MLKNRKNVNRFKNIIIVLITTIIAISFIANFSIAADTGTTDETIGIDKGEINPYYRPEWEIDKNADGTNKVELNQTNKTIKITVKGTAEKTQEINSNVMLNYSSDVTSNLTANDITVYVDGVAENGITKSVTKKQDNPAIYEITLSNLEEAVRRTNLPYKELSGNIRIKIGGRGENSSTFNSNILVDNYGNHGMMEIDTTGTWLDVTFGDNETDKNTANTMFADFIKPEFTYKFANTTIGNKNNGNTKKVTLLFDVTDKYFGSTDLATDTNADLITVKVANETVNTTVNVNKKLTKNSEIIINTITNEVSYKTIGYTLQTNERKVGERYELVIEGLEQLDENGISNGYTYSGPMSISFPSGKAKDLSGNLNDATTITIGVDETDGNPNTSVSPDGTIVDVVDPVWELGDINLDEGIIKLRAKDKYFDRSEITEANITIYVNGIVSTIVTKDITSVVATNIIGTVDGMENQIVGKEYTLKVSNIIASGNDYTTFVPTNLTADSLNNNAGFKYKNENGGNISLKIASGTIYDKSGNTNREQEIEVGNIDNTSPEIYEVQKIQNETNKTETIIFNVTDRNYDPSDLITTDEISVWIDNQRVDNIVKEITSIKPIKLDIDGETGKTIGHQYTVVLSNIVETEKQTGKSYLEWSGKLELKIVGSAARDLKGNTLNPNTTTISDFVDYIKPEMQAVTVTNPIDRTNKTYKMAFSIIDKYLNTSNMVTADEIKVYIDGEEATSITKTITSTPITATFNKTVPQTSTGTTTNGTYTIGHTYQLVLSDFEQSLKQSGKNFMEWSGTVKIEILQNAVSDTEGNTLDADATKRTVNGEHVDFIKPVIEKVSSDIDQTAKTQTIIFNVMDKYLDTSDTLTANEIIVSVDGETPDIIKTLTKVQDFTANINGNTTHLVGQQYKLVLSGIEKNARNDKGYKDWSGTVAVEVVENAVKDTSNNKLAPETEKRIVTKDFVDFIKPEIEYTHQSSDIDHGNKKYTMTFDVTDKYYTTGQISLDDLTIKMKNGQKDSNGNEIVYDLKQLATEGKINITLGKTDKTATFNKTVNGTIKNGTYVIGHTYTLTISNLEQLEIQEGHTTADYSGIITVAVAGNKIKDTSNNANNATTITSGINIPGGTGSGNTGTPVDVVDPLWTKVSSSAYAIDPNNKSSSIATLTFRGTDTYFDQSTLTIDKIKIIVNGEEVTSGITKTLSTVTNLTEDRILNGVASTGIKYGEQYTLTIKGFAQNVNQVKIRIPKGVLVDKYGNDSEETDFIVYNVLKLEPNETNSTSAFLGESLSTTIYPTGITNLTPIERQNIEKVIFTNNISGSTATGVQRVWDVSAQGDKSIIAWTSNTTAPYTVYVGSKDEIFANQNSSRLFSYIGYSSVCTATTAIENIDLLNVNSVTNMNTMFSYTGYNTMTSLDLGDKFDTSNVTDMSSMFVSTGYTAMTSLDLGDKFDTTSATGMEGMFYKLAYESTGFTTFSLGDKFDTSNVTIMKNMFNSTGYTSMTSLNLGNKFNTKNVVNADYMFYDCGHMAMTNLNLGDKFDTSNVTSMNNMFANCGYTAMTELNLKNKFNTSKVRNMSQMFFNCGHTAMTTLKLGDKFDTSAVTNMYNMFYGCGQIAMTSLDLGDKFDTRNVTDMTAMFFQCGNTAMTTLDLGPLFTKIASTNANMFTRAGKSGAKIYAPESIYKNKNAFKLSNTDTTSSVSFSTGTIVPIYKPEWTHTSTYDATNKTLSVTVKGSAYKNQTIDSNVTINYASNVTSILSAEKLQVYVNGVEVTSTVNPTVTVNAATPSTNGTSGKTEITHKIVLSNLEEAARRANLPYKELSGNISIKIAGRGEATGTYTANVLKDEYGNQSMMETDQSGTWIDVKVEDAETNHNTANKLFTDFIKPEFTYLSSETTVNRDNKILTMKFSVTDKYFDAANSNLALTDLRFSVDGEIVDINKAENSFTAENIYAEDGTTRIGTKYTLVVKNLQKYQGNDNDAFSYSGIVSIGIPANKFQDFSGNKNNGTTITVGIDDTDGNTQDSQDPNGQIVDVVDPVWKLENIDITNDKLTFDLTATDKYYLNNTLTNNINQNMLLYVDGKLDGDTNNNGILDAGETPKITKTISAPTSLSPAGTGVRYKVTLSNWNADEYTGSSKIIIQAGTITDKYGNSSIEQEFIIGHIDFIKPVIQKVSSSIDTTNKTHTLVFKATDKFMDITDLITTDELTIYVDGEIATGVTIKSFTNTPIIEERSGTTYTIGHEYTLILSNFEQAVTRINRSREFTDWSGTVEVKVAEGAVKDIQVTNPNGVIAGGNLSEETTLTGNFIDFIQPKVTYEYAEADIVRNHANKAERKYTMVIDITDKYFKNSAFETAFNSATTDADKLAVIQQYLTIKIDGVDITNVDTVTKKIVSIDDITAVINKTVNGTITKGGTHTIGKRFTLEISDLEQELVEINDEYLNYSGIITVAIKANTATDTTGLGNSATTITSGVDMAGNIEFDASDSAKVIDLVDPLWEISGTVTAKPFNQTATIPVKGTDKYISTNNLQPSDITVVVTTKNGQTTVNGANVGTYGMTLTITPENIAYGKNYIIKLDGYASDAYQVKLTFRDGILVDQSGNTSQETSFILFSSLKETSTETSVNSGFLGNANIQRQKIEQVIFKDNLDGINNTRWDVTQLQDNSVWGWYEQTARGTYIVYIGSYIIINGNVNSSYLFANIGRDANCAVTGDTAENQIIKDIHLLHVDGVQNMSHMFDGCGYTNMKSLDLGDYFDTSSVTDMSYMFNNCGYTKMTNLDLGTKLYTDKVTNMSNMFNSCGQNELVTLKIGTLTNIIDFDTRKVTNMSGMFQNFGKAKLTTLKLGEEFYTTAVTDMRNMFNGCGSSALTNLDLGPYFTKIANTSSGFSTNLGNANTTIYAPEAIYSNMRNFKLNTTSNTKISIQGTIEPVYRPEWTKVSSTLDKTNKQLKVVVKGNANKPGTTLKREYLSDVTSTLNSNDVTVYVDGELASIITANVSGVTEITNTTTGKKEVQYTITLSNFEEAIRQTGKNFKEWSGNVGIQLAKGSLKDKYGTTLDGNGNIVATEGSSNLAVIDIAVDATGTTTQTENIVVEETTKQNANATTEANMFADYIKPEFTYVYSEGDINYADKTLKVTFDVTDKYFSSTDLLSDTNAELITVKVDEDANANSAIIKTLRKVEDLYTTLNGTANHKVGERYELTISRLEQNPNDSFKYSGTVTIGFGSGIITDLSGNKNNGTTITVGIDDTDGNTQDTQDPNGTIVDVVDPIWKVENLHTTTTDGITTAEMDLIATDKFFKESILQKDDIQIKVAGVNIATTAPELERTLSTPTYIKWDNTTGTYVETTQANANGVKYRFTISHLEETYEAFFAERAKYAINPATGRLYREYSGPIAITIPAGKAIDNSGNSNIEFTFEGIGHIDTLKPEIVKVSSTSQINTQNVELSKHIVVFDIVDKYLDTSSITTTDTSKIHVYLDGEEANTITKTITNIEQLNATVNGITQKVGYRYTLELSNFENPRTVIDYNREYTDWSGDLTIKIDANVAYDVNPTNPTDRRGNAETILAGNEDKTSNLEYADHVDYIKPDATYEYSDSDVKQDAENGKTFTMTFDVTDKFYKDEELSIADIKVLISAENQTGTDEDKYDDLTSNNKIGKSLRSENITNTVNGVSKVIGKRYTLVLTNLEQVQKIEGKYYLDYSGAITIVIPKNKIKDTSGNGNDATSITSGINIPGGEISDIEAIDVVAPIWERISFTTDIHTKTAVIKVRGTDKYFLDNEDGYGTLTLDEIKLFVNGTEQTGNITITDENKLYEERIVLPEYGDGEVSTNPTTETVQYGVEYTITITDFTITANQVKIQLTEGSLIDQSNNKSKATEFMVYNTLISAESETEATSKFLGEIPQSGKTAIARQDIEKVVFVNSTQGSTATGVQNVWDVSAQRDSSILAWYSETTAPYTVYIGSDEDIYGNMDSSYLFSYIGYSSVCTAETAIENIEVLHTENITNMSNMFNYTGYNAMTSLDLGNNFDTSNVTNMDGMFKYCGHNAMTTIKIGDATNTINLDTSKVTSMQEMFAGFANKFATLTLGTDFDTSNVTNMASMFNNTGYTAMTSLNLGENFDTSNVTNMVSMFNNTGYTAMTSLNLGENFDTSNVINMVSMFDDTGHTAMISLDLGDKFDTSNVLYMNGMFQNCGYTAMTTLDLGEKFYTTNVTNMENMFKNCGYTAMTTLDLGPAFTKIADTNTDMFTNTGKTGCTIYAPESIYSDMKHFKLNTDSTTTIEYTQGTINAKYKPEWSKISSSITVDNSNLANSTMTITVKGNVDSTAYTNAIQTITSAVTTGNDATNQIHVKVDGENAETITQTVEVIKNTSTEVQYKITLSNFEEAVRQSGKNFKEWAGNVALQFAKGSLVDAYGNKNMIEIDTNVADLTNKKQIQIEDDTLLESNVTTDKMFSDFIKPEFTYEYLDTVIGSGPEGDKKVIVTFDVTDKYFASTQLSTDNLANLITVRVDEDVTANTAITKTLTKLQDLYYTVNGNTSHKVGERYQLIIEGLESENGVGYSGPMTLAFPAGIVQDKSGNANNATTITIGIDEPENHPDHNGAEIVDVVNPIWVGPHDVNTIVRTNDAVNITILGNDKYYLSNSLTTNKIKVYVDNVEQSSITKQLTEITDNAKLQELATNAGLTDVKVGYILKLSTFGELSGTTKIVIQAGTIKDTSGNENLETTIFAGNITWVETNEPLNESDIGYPRYPAYRQDIVDFIKPVIQYQYSAVENAENPDIDYVAKKVTVKFTVTDKYFLESTIMNSDRTLNTDVVKIKIDIDGVYTDITDQITKTITETNIANGKEYILEVSNLERNPYYDAFDFSGPMQLTFAKDAIDDTSGNKNNATTITIDTDNGDNPGGGIIVDVVDPIIKITADENPLSYINSQNTINRDIVNETGTVKVIIRAEDKYLDKSTANLIAEAIKVKVQKPDGTVVEDATKVENPITVTVAEKTTTDLDKFEYEVTLGNFTTNEGITSITIPQGIIKDTSGNGNKETEVFVGNSTWTGDGEYTAFRDSIVDFTMPKWSYVTSSISRNREGEIGTVTLKILGYDIYKKEVPTADELKSLINVYVNNTKNTDIQVAVQKDTDTETSVQYTVTLSNFGTNDGQVKISIPANAMKDTSGNGNKVTEILVGNTTWIEKDVETNTTNPIYTAFRDSIVDFIKPVIKYQYEENVNPVLDRENETVKITFTSTDTNYLSLTTSPTNLITLDGMKIYVDNMLVHGEGVNAENKITASLSHEVISDGSANGIKYTLTLSALELNKYLGNEIFERHSGVIKLVFEKDQVADTSGNKNIETTIVVDNDNGDDNANGVIVDFINPNIYYLDKYINWEKRYALVTLRATDRFYDENTALQPSDITLYEQKDNGEYIQINNFDGKIEIKQKSNGYGKDIIIRLNDFEEEFKMKIKIAKGKIGDTSGNFNDETEITVTLDNRKPTWSYVNADTTKFEIDGKLSFEVKGQDKFLDIANSNLDVSNLKVLKDGKVYLDGSNSSDATKITVNYEGMNETEKSKTYTIDITGLTEVATYSLVFAKDILIDEFGNTNAATTISFSKSAITANTGNYTNIAYHVSPDLETKHHSYVHELMSVNTTGTNFENTTYRPSTLGELFNNGENPLFAEPMYVPSVDGYTVSQVYAPKSFAGWAEADSDGNVITGGNIYGLYDEIPNTVTNLKAVWQDATVVFVSRTGNNSNDGKLPTTPVKDLQTAYSKLNANGTAESNIIVIMDAVEFNSSDTLTGNATITSLYAGADYRATQNAELKVSSNMVVNGDIIFDNIKLYVSSENNKLVSNYSGDITLGRGIITPSDNFTFGAIVGGNFETETSTGELGTHTVRVEAGKYKNIIAGSSLTSSTTSTKSITHNVVIGNMRDTAISRNDKLTITGYVVIGENEKSCYPSGATSSTLAESKIYANVTLYSGTIDNGSNHTIYLRSYNGQTDGLMNFEMFGGNVIGNIYGGSRVANTAETTVFNTMKFYGGTVTGNIYGQGEDDTFTGSSSITLQGNFSITGDIYGGSNRTSTATGNVGKGDSTILVNSSSVTVNGNIYGGGRIEETSTGYINGATNITINSGTITGDIYGSGYNCGNADETNITIENGAINGNIYGGAYKNQARTTSNITVLGGTIGGNIYGGNNNISSQLEDDAFFQNANITIGDTDATKAPKINGVIYGGGKYDKVDKATIHLIECANITSVYGGSEGSGLTITSDIYLEGMTVNEIYGGSNGADNATPTVSVSKIHLQSGTATDVYGGGFNANSTQVNITLEGTANVTNIYGGPNTGGKVTTSDITLKSGTVTNVFGGGNSAQVGTSNVTLDGITIDTIYGGSKDAGLTDTANVTLVSGTVTNVFGGGLKVGATKANIKHQGEATVTNIYGGSNGGETGTTNIDILNSTVENIYGGNYMSGTTQNTNINVHGTATVTGNIFGGGYKSSIGKNGATGSATINIAGGTINGDINGGSEQGIVYGNTKINVGFDAIENTSLTPQPISIIGTIYGAGSTLTKGEVTVVGNTTITMDNGTTYPISYYTADGKEKSIYGSGKGGAIYSNGTTVDQSTIHLKDFGTAENIYMIKSIENTGTLYIGNSTIELVGAIDKPDIENGIGHYYTLNTITNSLTVYDNTTLYTQRGFNKVGGYYSYLKQKNTKATVTITDGTATTNVDNRLYTLEGVNLIFAKKEVTLENKATLERADWGEVTGMTYFGTYKNTSTGKKYDLSLFKAGTYVEAQYNTYHDIKTDGFYTNTADGAQLIDTVNYTNYCDWIVNAPTINYDVDLIASTYGQHSIAEILLDKIYASDYTYAPETVYTVNAVSTNTLKPGIELVDPTIPGNVPTVSTNANNVFGLTMETTNSGWKQKASTTILTADNGSFDGSTIYASDRQSTPGSIKFKIYNSLNITEEKDLGIVTIKLTGQQPVNGSGTESYTFNVVIAINLQTLAIELKDQYTPMFTDKYQTELSYTTDSKVDLTYVLFNTKETTPYASSDYRVISTTVPLPTGTKLTMKDYGQGDTLNKVYYYQVATDTDYYGTDSVDGVTRYLYKLTKFAEMGSTNASYTDSTTYYHSSEGYMLEKYDLSIDFINANIDGKVSSDILARAQETYLELRSSSGSVKFDNGDTTIKYNLVPNKNAIAQTSISNAGNSYSVVETIEIPITIDGSILEQNGILDTKYHNQIAGIAVQIVGENNVRIKAPELQNFKLTNNKTGEVYRADSNGVIRMPIVEGLGSSSAEYTLSVTQSDVSPGIYRAQVLLYTADDGKYYGTEAETEPLEFNITFINRLAGLLGVKAEDETSRLIDKTTGLNLVDGSTTNKAIDLTVGIANPSDETNIRVELYKRNPTYTDLTDETTYTGASYTLVDIKDYLKGNWTEAEAGSKEYIISEKKTYSTPVELETFEFEKAIKDGISTGEYKLVFKAYSDDTLVQTFSKTFVVIQ